MEEIAPERRRDADRPRSYAVIGTGAVGGLYGARLARAGHPVHFLAHSDYEHIRRHGLRVDSVDGNFRLRQVAVYRRAADMPRCDVVLITLKATANAILPAVLPHVTRPDGVVILIQNGLGAEETVARIVQPAAVLGGLSFLCCEKEGPGHIRHLDYGRLTIAPYVRGGRAGLVSAAMRRIAADFERAGTLVQLLGDLVLARWKKLVWNVPFNGLGVVLDASTRDLLRDPAVRGLARDLMDEVVRGAAAQGRHIPRSFVARMMRDTERMTPYLTSMKLDFDRGRTMEVDAIYGAPLRAAAKAGCDLPRMALLHALLTFLNPRPVKAICTKRNLVE